MSALLIPLALSAASSDGTWRIENAPTPAAQLVNAFLGVHCVSSSNCWSVGFYAVTDPGPSSSLAEHWNGASWQVVATDTNSTPGQLLQAVTCVNTNDCWGVGVQADSSTGESPPSTKHWNGADWSDVPAPRKAPDRPTADDGSPYALHNVLNAIACVASDDCWAVGTYHSGGDQKSFIEHWDGSAWAIVASPNAGEQNRYSNDYLKDISCVSSTDCWAVGFYEPAPGDHLEYRPLAQHWDGNVWSLVAVPTSGGQEAALFGVSCITSADCWAAGGYNPYSADATALVVHWDGTQWNFVPTPALRGQSLFDVSCASARMCRASGTYDLDTASHNFAMGWDGSTWSVDQIPDATNPAGGPRVMNILFGISCPDEYNCVAVGRSEITEPPRGWGAWDPTAVHYNAPVPPPNLPPTANAGPDFAIDEGQGGHLIGSGADPENETLSYVWRQLVAAGDPQVDLSDADTATLAFTAPQVGSDHLLSFQLTVTDPEGAFASDLVSVTVRNINLPPTAVLSATPGEGDAPLTVSFDASGSSDPDSGDSLTSYAMNFGDGSLVQTQDSPTFNHTYQSPGVFTATLAVTDNHGRTNDNSAQTTITVRSVNNGVAPTEQEADVGNNRVVGGALSFLSALGFGLVGLLRMAIQMRRRRHPVGASGHAQF